MDQIPFDVTCAQCGRLATPESWGRCELCARFFCGRHLTVVHGLSTCESCEPVREAREAAGPSSADVDRVVSLLRADVEATIGPGHDAAILGAAIRQRRFTDDPSQFTGRVVDEVQQHFHDTFVDTTWPACPRHGNHPLWHAGGEWRCNRTGEAWAQLGGLSAIGTGR